MGKKLPSITKVDPKTGFGFTPFYEGIFQTVKKDENEGLDAG